MNIFFWRKEGFSFLAGDISRSTALFADYNANSDFNGKKQSLLGLTAVIGCIRTKILIMTITSGKIDGLLTTAENLKRCEKDWIQKDVKLKMLVFTLSELTF